MKMEIVLSKAELLEAVRAYLLTNNKSPLFISSNLDHVSDKELPDIYQVSAVGVVHTNNSNQVIINGKTEFVFSFMDRSIK